MEHYGKYLIKLLSILVAWKYRDRRIIHFFPGKWRISSERIMFKKKLKNGTSVIYCLGWGWGTTAYSHRTDLLFFLSEMWSIFWRYIFAIALALRGYHVTAHRKLFLSGFEDISRETREWKKKKGICIYVCAD